MKYTVIRSRKQVQIIELESTSASGALRDAELLTHIGAILDTGDEWSYEVSPVKP